MEKKQQQGQNHRPNDSESLISPIKSILLHLICGLGLGSAFWAAENVYGISLIRNPSELLRLLWLCNAPIVLLIYSLSREDPNHCTFVRAMLRGLLGLPAGAFVNAAGAIVLGAPVMPQYWPRTLHWSLLMSELTFVPAACVYGFSWNSLQRLLTFTKPIGSIDYMISLPGHGAVIGAWFGAWPMPLDWERPWQEWPICVTYGAMAGYLVGTMASCGLALYSSRRLRLKSD